MSKNAFYVELLKQEQELQAALVSVRNLLTYFNVSDNNSITDATQVVDQEKTFYAKDLGDYDPEWSQSQKALYALQSLNKGVAEEVAERLVEFDKELSLDKANRIATSKLSQLYRNKEIDAVKVGKKYRYYAR